MNGQIDTAPMSDRPEYQYSTQPSANIGGISFAPLQIIGQTVALTGFALIGTIPLPEPLDFSPLVTLSFVFPDPYNVFVDDEYSRTREEMIAAGLPMLSDEEVRSEIRERKGIRGEMES